MVDVLLYLITATSTVENQDTEAETNLIVSRNENGEKQKIDPETGLILSKGWKSVKAHCVTCHSIKLVTQNRMSRKGWLESIRWMQKEHGLWPLREEEQVILNYLSKNYGIPDKEKGSRRKKLIIDH